MERDLMDKISKIRSLLSTEQKTQEIVEIESSFQNRQIIDYLENIGAEKIRYELSSKLKSGQIQEKGGITYLWYKKADNVWIIRLWEINRL